ncbi:MAG: hypothetical protein ACPGSM_01560 [Thiolinea sp.]
MTTVASDISPDDSTKRILVLLSASLLPFLFSTLLAGLFYLLGDYKVVERAAAKTEFASIDFPEKNKVVGNPFTAKGSITKLPENTVAFLMAERGGLYWPKKYLHNTPGEWTLEIHEPKRKNSKLRLVVLAMTEENKAAVDQWYASGQNNGIKRFKTAIEVAAVEVKQK